MGYVLEEPHLYAHLTGLEYLTMVAQLRNLSAKSSAEKIAGLRRLFSHNPDLILLDEPFPGLGRRQAVLEQGEPGPQR